jgi:hypothetical protein
MKKAILIHALYSITFCSILMLALIKLQVMNAVDWFSLMFIIHVSFQFSFLRFAD